MCMTRMYSHRHKARVDMAQTREHCDIPSSFRPIFDVPTFLVMTSRAQPRGDPMKSNRRANPLQATPRVVPGRLVLENDGATSRSNWPAELRSGRQEPDDDDPFNRRSHMTGRVGSRPLFIPTTGWQSLK